MLLGGEHTVLGGSGVARAAGRSLRWWSQGHETGTRVAATGGQRSGQTVSTLLECAVGPTREASRLFPAPLWPGGPFPQE